MRLRFLFFLFAYVLFGLTAHAQRIVGQDTLYGNEWLVAGQEYAKFMLAEDGIFAFSGSDLRSAGIELNGKLRQDLTIYSFGEKVAVHIDGPASGLIDDTDRFIFVGNRNRNQLDSWLYDDENAETLHPDASLISDSTAYYITFESNSNPRFLNATAPTVIGSAKTSFQTENTFTWREGHQSAPLNRNVSLSNFSPAEGFTNGLRASSIISQTLSQGIPGTSVDIEVRFVGSGGVAHAYQLGLNNDLLDSGSFFGAELNRFSLNNAAILPSNRVLRFSLTSGGSSDRLAFGQISSRFERSGELNSGVSTVLHLNGSDTSTYAFWGAGIAFDSLFAFSTDQSIHYEHNSLGDSIYIKPLALNKEIILGIPKIISNIQIYEPTTTTFEEDVDGIILTSKALMQTSGSRSVIQDYANYRISQDGGRKKLVILYAEDLYNEFGFGVPRHPQAIRNAIHFYRTQSPSLNYLLLIGKGRSYNLIRTPAQLGNSQNASAFVPTFGSPASDVMLSTFPGSNKPTLFSARIPAESLEEVDNFLDKIRAVESGLVSPNQDDIEWRRNYVHLSGGDEPQQQARIKSVMSNLGNQLSESSLSGEVFSYFRQNSSPVESSQLDKVFFNINEGVSLINFYGHGSVSILGFNIDFPDRFANQVKTPPFLIFGCSAGNVHLPGKGVVERLFNLEDKGVSFAGANSTLSFESDINQFLPILYRNWGRPWDYGGTAGSVIGEALNEYLDSYTGSQKIAFVQQYQLVGDPMHQLYLPNTPDLTWDEDEVSVSPKILVPTDQTVTISADMLNLGRKADSVAVILTRVFQDGTTERHVKTVRDVGYRSTLIWELPAKSDVVGVQQFSLQIDSLNSIEERLTSVSEQNNSLEGSLLEAVVLSNAAEVIYPANKELLNCPTPLFGITSNPFAASRTYKLDVAVDASFDRILESKTIEQKGGVLQWEPSVLQTGETYYWRVAPFEGDSLLAGYHLGSFTCKSIDEPKGLALESIDQFSSNREESSLSRTGSGWTFPSNTKEFYIRNQIRTSAEYPVILENGALREANYGNDIRSGVYVFVVDPTNLEALVNPVGGLYGTETPATWRDRTVFGFLTSDSIQRSEVVAFLDTIIPTGYYVSFLTIFDEGNSYKSEEWEADEVHFGRSIFSVLEEQGATLVRSLSDSVDRPYIFSYIKDQGAIDEKLAAAPDEIITMTLPYTGSWFTGRYVSEPFVLADSIESVKVVHDDQRSIEELGFWFSVFRTDENGDVDTLASGATTLLDLRTAIGSEANERLSVAWSCTDTDSRIPLNVTSVILKARARPDLVFNMEANQIDDKLSATFGDSLFLGTTIFNASDRVVDSMCLKFSSDQRVHLSSPLDTGITLYNLAPFTNRFVPYSTYNKSQEQTSTVVRAQISVAGVNSMDRNPNNNFVFRTIAVKKDLTNPLLKMSVDGELLVDGALISSLPEIVISALDDNDFLAGGDVNWKVMHTKPEGTPEELTLGSSELSVSLPGNNRQKYLSWTPEQLSDGIHTVQVYILDESETIQRAELTRSFEVVNKQSISSFIPYPNPAVDNVRFAYELTGSVPVDKYQIDIYTTSGKIVQSLGVFELGTLKPGRHLTDFAWNGTDMYNQKLARGIYLYKVNTLSGKSDSPSIEHRATKNDKYTKSFGKIVLLR